MAEVWRGMKAKAMLAAMLLSVAGSGMADEGLRDPYEGFNRSMFSVNEVIDTYAAKPVAKVYEEATPLPLKVGVGNFFGNVGDLWVGINSALQGKFSDAGLDLARLAINSTIGIFGLFDVATELGLEKHDEDFGQTLAVWGVDDGGYVFLPLIGPRSLRDTAGWAVDFFAADPVGYVRPYGVRNSGAVLRFVDVRASLLPTDKLVEEAALDKYAYVRDAYLQRRRNQIYDGRPPRLDD